MSLFLTFSQGIHLVFDGNFLPGNAALMIPKTSDGRVLFCIPWQGHLLVGTTDTPVDAPSLEPKALQSEIDFVLETAGQYLSAKPSRADILSVFAGIRPLVRPSRRAKSSAVSRGHHVFVGNSGLVTITGGKWTTYRRMAEDAVDMAARIAGLADCGSITEHLTIEASEHFAAASESKLHPGPAVYSPADVVRGPRRNGFDGRRCTRTANAVVVS